MNWKNITYIILGCMALTISPCMAADGAKKKKKAATEEVAEAASNPELTAARKRLKDAQAAMDQFQKEKKARSKVKPKWFRDEAKAFAEAKKHNLPVWCVYSDPPTCAIYQAFEKEVINSGPVKNAKGAYIGYISNTPLPEFQCRAKPYGYLYTPEKKPMIPLPYMSTKPAKDYAARLKEYSEKLLEKPEKAVTKELEYSKKLVEALAAGQPAPEEEPDEEEEEDAMNPAGRMGPQRGMPQRGDMNPNRRGYPGDRNMPGQDMDGEEEEDSGMYPGRRNRPTRNMQPEEDADTESDY